MAYNRHTPGSKQTGKEPGLFSAWIEAEKLMQIALVLPCAAFIGWLIGAWLDRHFHQSWIAIVGIVFGGVAGLTFAIRVALAANKDPKLQDDDTSTPGQDSGGPGKGSGSSSS